MSRRSWILLGAAAAILLLSLAATLALPRLLQVERYRARLEQALSEATGWRVELGRMDFRAWRGLALTVEPASLREQHDGSSIEVATLLVKARLLPLLRGRLDIREVALGQPEILLVRRSAAEGWVLPLPTWGRGRPAGQSGSGTEGLSISIGTLSISRGSLRLEDRTGARPSSLRIEDVDAALDLSSGAMNGSGRLPDKGGSMSWSGNLAGSTRVRLDAVLTESLALFLGPDLLRPGGRISGEIVIALPLVEGHLTGKQLGLLSGEKPLDDVQLEFEISRQGPAWRANRLELHAGAARLAGRGVVAPDLDLALELPATPLEPSLAFAQAMFPVPLVLSPPGTAEAAVTLRQPAGGVLVYQATGNIAAARFVPGGVLPPASDVRAAFALSPEGRLEVKVLDGRVAGGPLRGVLGLDRIAPPGTMTFEGEVEKAQLGGLLVGLIEKAEGRITGPAALAAHLRVDLGREALGPESLGGTLSLRANQVSLPGWDLENALRERIGLARSSEIGSAAERIAERLQLDIGFDGLPWSLTRFELAIGGVTAAGRGRYDPLSDKIDVDLVGECDAELTAKLLGKYPELKRIVSEGRLAVPLEVEGALMKPSIKVDLGKLLRVEKPGKNEIKKLLEGLLNRKGS